MGIGVKFEALVDLIAKQHSVDNYIYMNSTPKCTRFFILYKYFERCTGFAQFNPIYPMYTIIYLQLLY